MAQNTQNDYSTLKRRNRRRLIGAVVMVLLSILILWQVLSKAPPPRVESENIVINDGSGTIDQVPLDNTDAAVFILPPLETVSAPAEHDRDLTIGSLNTQSSDTEQRADTVVVIAAEQPERNTQSVTEATSVKPPVKKPEKVTKAKVAPPAKIVKPQTMSPQDILDGKLPPSAANLGRQTQVLAATGKVMIQVAALTDATKAIELKERLSTLGITANISQVNTSKGNISRVRVGPFARKLEAEKTLQRLNSAGIDGIVVSQ